MNDRLTKLWVRTQIRMRSFWEEFRTEEKGAAEIVAIIMIVAVVVIVAALFKDEIGKAAEKVFKSVNTFIDEG